MSVLSADLTQHRHGCEYQCSPRKFEGATEAKIWPEDVVVNRDEAR